MTTRTTTTDTDTDTDATKSTGTVEGNGLRPGSIDALANRLRVRAVEMADAAGSGHPTSAMSAADLIAVLITRHLRLDPPDALGNDRLIFSKGHATPLLYGALESLGILDEVSDDVVADYRSLGSRLEGHPTPLVPGVPAATGSLGLGLSIGAGIATAHRRAELAEARVWVLCGDSELSEGSNWEAIEHAGAAELAGLVAIVDVNRLGQTGPTRHGWDLDAYAQRFASFGWHTITIDGHDLEDIDRALVEARSGDAPTAILARTVKGRGASETSDEEGKHGKPLDEPDEALEELGADERELRVVPPSPDALVEPPSPTSRDDLPSWDIGDELATRDGFGEALVAVGPSRSDLVVIDGEVKNSTRTAAFADEFPDQFIEAYIAEQLMAGIGIGLDAVGWRPLMATFGAFLTRAHDVLRMATVSRTRMTVVGSHAGVSIGEDGPSQMALEDLAMMRCLAGSTVVSPADANAAAALLVTLLDRDGISYLRTMRGDTPIIHTPGTDFPIGGSIRVHESDAADVTVFATGVTVHEALTAVRDLHTGGVDVIDMYSIKPIDREAITSAAERSSGIVVVEDHRREGGLGDAVNGVLTEIGAGVPVRHLAVDAVPGSATPAEQRRAAGIDAEAIRDAVSECR